MRRLLRWAFNLAAPASAVLFVGVCAVWVRSESRDEAFAWSSPLRVESLRLTDGGEGTFDCYDEWVAGWDQGWLLAERESCRQRINFGYPAHGYDAARRSGHFRHRTGPSGETRGLLTFAGSTAWWNRRGFLLRLGRFNPPTPFTNLNYAVQMVAAPCWVVALAALALPFYRAGRWWRRRRERKDRCCAACGYDLRATPEEGGALFDRCPECGVVKASGATGAAQIPQCFLNAAAESVPPRKASSSSSASIGSPE